MSVDPSPRNGFDATTPSTKLQLGTLSSSPSPMAPSISSASSAGCLLPKMPKEATDEEMDTLLGGIVALRDEIYWFRSEAMRWTIQLDLVSIKVTTQEYCEFLEQLSQGNFEYAIAVTALWAIEFVYYESFALCTQSNAKTPTELREACERWSNMEFKNYCVLLKGLADKYLEGSNLHVRQKAEEIFVQILKQEIKFWDMSTCDENCI
ncbi:hypothetical protein O6H91_02G018100 [Diphasiastrum complanatum]|uniref:Uncharacterized protein n=1 Tax=Diphasiastrum complanatum TaxID=34168 RepID=A0ACC2EDA8_DIPCM|nr:hypothetical protein O6H91_02G018100 [Diphasiastrum complanatum]